MKIDYNKFLSSLYEKTKGVFVQNVAETYPMGKEFIIDCMANLGYELGKDYTITQPKERPDRWKVVVDGVEIMVFQCDANIAKYNKLGMHIKMIWKKYDDITDPIIIDGGDEVEDFISYIQRRTGFERSYIIKMAKKIKEG